MVEVEEQGVSFEEDSLLASVVRESFYEFVKEFWSIVAGETFVDNWHIKYLCDELQEAADRVFRNEPKIHDIIINVPPGSSKSTIASQLFPAWVWTRMPSAKFICASYAHQVALKDSLKTRDVVRSELYRRCFKIQLREDENTKGLFTNTKTGWRLSVGVGGLVTGYHGHFLIVDDPINPEEAMSELELKSVNRWMRTTLPTRKIDKSVSVTILIQQRLHQGDPTGEALERTPEGVRHICLPGELTEKLSPPHLAKHYVDGLLDPKRLSRETLKKLEVELGPYGYAAQILQDPVPLGGGLFETNKFVLEDTAPSMVRSVRSWDKGATEKGGDWSVGILMGIDHKGQYWVLDERRGQWGANKRESYIRETAEWDGEKVEVVLEIEGGSGGKESGENTVKNLAGYAIHVYHPTGDKVARAVPFASQVGGGTVHILKRSWTKDYIEELKYFPNGRHDDRIDASSGGFNRLAKRRRKIGTLW